MSVSPAWTIEYQYIANVDPATEGHTGLDPGWISVSVDSSGTVLAGFGTAPIPTIRQRYEHYAITIPHERAEALRELLATSGYDARPGRRSFNMNEGEPVSVGLSVGGGEAIKRSFTLGEVPAGLRPFLAQMTALVLELQAHVVEVKPT